MQANTLSSTSSDPTGSSYTPPKAWKLKICPIKPLHDIPFLLTSPPSGTLYTLRERVANVLRRYGHVQDEHILLFVSSDGMSCALVEDGPIGDFMQDGEKVEVGLDEALAERSNGDLAEMQVLGKRGVSDEDDFLLEANRIAQKIKTEIGSKKGRKYEETIVEPEWPKPPSILSQAITGSSSLIPLSLMTGTGAASAALDAFEEKKKSMQVNGIAKAVASSSSSSSSSSSESDSSSSSDSDSNSDSSDSSSEADGNGHSSSSSSSSSDSSSDDSSSSSGSDSDSSSSSDSGKDDESSSAKTSLSTTTSISYPKSFVPPGKGLARTQRKNQLRRERRREEMQKEREQLFLKAKERAEKREKGEEVDEEAAEQAWMVDTKGSKPIVHNGLGKQRFGVVSRDSELVLPPGGGSFGIIEKQKRKKDRSAHSAPEQIASPSKSISTPSEQETSVKSQKPNKKRGVAFEESRSREPPPPSMRSMPVPNGIRLTSVNCDDCYNELDENGDLIKYGEVEEEVEEVNVGYAAFQARAKEALRLAKEEEERRELERGCEHEFSDGEDLIDHNDIFIDQDGGAWDDTHQGLTVKETEYTAPIHQRRDDNSADVNGAESAMEEEMEAAQSLFPDMPVSFGKKQDWDGNEPLTSIKSSVQLGEGDLDYGEPEDAGFRKASVHQDIKKLRDVLKNELEKQGKEEEQQKGDQVYEARQAALASLKTRRAANR